MPSGGKITEPGVRWLASFVTNRRGLRQEVRRELLAESKKHKAWKRLCGIPAIGPSVRQRLLGILRTPHRFLSKRPLWNYGGLAIEMHNSADHRSVDEQLQLVQEERLGSGPHSAMGFVKNGLRLPLTNVLRFVA